MKSVFQHLVALLLLLAAGGEGVQARTREFSVRAFHLDFRTEVMTMEALERLVDRLAARGINALVMEWEGSFPFEHNATLSNASAFTPEQIASFVDYCGKRGVEVIPLQNCFGHCEYILRLDRYGALRESPKDPSQVCPSKIGEATDCFTSIFADVAALHPSGYFHIGADETYLLGTCATCRARAEREGKSQLFVDYVRAMCGIVEKLGRKPLIWADMILKHPEALDELPQGLIFVDWNYGWGPNHFGDLENLRKRGVELWGAPALRSAPDNIYLTQWKKHFDNLADYVEYAREHDYTGMIETSWSTSGTYGYLLDDGNEILDMQPIRLVYPMSGFEILEAACCEAFSKDARFDPEAFVVRYAQTELGLDEADAAVLWRYFTMPQERVTVDASGARDALGRPVSEVLDESLRMRGELARIRPRRASEQVEHYRLMLDLRIEYLHFKQLEAQYQSPEFNRARAAELASELGALLAESPKLDRRFARLNAGFLKPREIAYVNTMRTWKMRSVLDRLKAIAR